MGSAIHPIGAFIQGPNPIQDIINGMVQGAQLHDQLQRAQDEHTAMAQAQIQQQRQNRIQDITQKMLLGANSRPVNPDGTVTETTQTPDVNLPGISLPGQPVSYTRKADKSRTVTYKDQDGNAMQRELLTPEEQIAKQVREKTELARAGQTDVSPLLQQMLGASQPGMDTPYGEAPNVTPPSNPFPNGVYVNPQQVPGIMGDMVRQQNSQRTVQGRENVANTNADARRYAADTSATARTAPKLSRTYTDDQNQMVGVYSDGTTKVLGPALPKPAGRGETISANQVAIQNRFQQRQQQADQATTQKAQLDEQSAWTQQKQLQDAIAAKDGETIPSPANNKLKVVVTPGARKSWQDQLDGLPPKIATLQQKQKQLIEKWGGTYAPAGGSAGSGTPAPPLPATAAASLKKGTVTTFRNGQRWTLDANGKPQQVQAQGQ